MKHSTFVTNVNINDPHNPGVIINLSVHEIDGGYIGIDNNFIDEVANYIINPYQTTQLIMLNDSTSDDDIFDPPVDDDTYYGFAKLLHAFDMAVLRGTDFERNTIMSELESMTGISHDRIDVILGFAQAVVASEDHDE
jgi:hypothetical protein